MALHRCTLLHQSRSKAGRNALPDVAKLSAKLIRYIILAATRGHLLGVDAKRSFNADDTCATPSLSPALVPMPIDWNNS